LEGVVRIGIDARYLSHGIMGGINSYLRNLLPALFEVAEEHQIYLYADTKQPFELIEQPGNVVLRLVNYRTGLSSLYYDYYLKRTMARDLPDVVHFPANRGIGPSQARSIITLHDEINITPLLKIYAGHPKNLRTLTWMTYLHFHSIQSVRKADLIVTISKYARQQILRWGKLSDEKVIAIHHGRPTNVQKVTDARELAHIRSVHGLTKEFVLADALKNPAVLVRAWKLLPEEFRTDKEIVFFSRRESIAPEVHEAVEDGFAKFILRPERDILNALFSMAMVFVFPSWIEGFGIPLLEAMICGVPIIASDRGSIPEVLGEAGLVIDAEDEAMLAKYLENLFRSSDERERLSALGYARVQNFSWKDSATKLLEAYRGLAVQK
jgi:glycosyltransferase involved in cell wall biosynthesis